MAVSVLVGTVTSAAPASVPSLASSAVTVEPESGRVVVRVPMDRLASKTDRWPRPQTMQVYQDGERIPDVQMAVEHQPVSLAVLLEMGGRSYQVNQALKAEAPHLLRPLIDRLGKNDRLAIFTYDQAVHTAMDFDAAPAAWKEAIDRIDVPRLSEANLYDAAIEVLDRLKSRTGQRALVLMTTGVDTFSRARFEDLLARARETQIPVYCLSLADLARHRVSSGADSWTHVNWSQIAAQQAQVAQVSGGRVYSDARGYNAEGIFDDLMERLRVQYVLTFTPPKSTPGDRAGVVAIRETGADGLEPRSHLIEVRLTPPSAARSVRSIGEQAKAAPVFQARYSWPSRIAEDAQAIVSAR